MDHLAELIQSQWGQVTPKHAFELAQWRGDRADEIEIQRQRMLRRPAEEWSNFVQSMGRNSFAKPWAQAAA